MKKADEKRSSATLADLRALKKAGEIKAPRADATEIDIPDDVWAQVEPLVPPGKTSVHLRVDTDVLDWFKSKGRGHLTRMNAVLRHYFLSQTEQKSAPTEHPEK